MRLVDGHTRMDGGQRQLPVTRFENAEVGDDHTHLVADACREIELSHERPRRLPKHHEDVAHPGRDLRSAAAAGQAYRRPVVVADYGAVQIAVPVDLGGTEEADVDAATLEPVGEHLRHGHD